MPFRPAQRGRETLLAFAPQSISLVGFFHLVLKQHRSASRRTIRPRRIYFWRSRLRVYQTRDPGDAPRNQNHVAAPRLSPYGQLISAVDCLPCKASLILRSICSLVLTTRFYFLPWHCRIGRVGREGSAGRKGRKGRDNDGKSRIK
jgi:hypothetical protein